MKFLMSMICFLFLSLSANAQDSKLAAEYYNSGEYEKAAQVYMKLYEKSKYRNDYYFQQFIQSLMADENYSQAENEIKDQLKRTPQNVQLYVTYGNLYERMFEEEKAKKQYKKAIDNLPADRSIISKLGNAFLRLTKFDQAIEAYEKGTKLLNDEKVFAYSIADLYRRKGDSANMIKFYLLAAENNKNMLTNLKTNFQRNLKTEEDMAELKTQLFAKVQEYPDQVSYQELLEWLYINQKNYNKAFSISRSIDLQLEENGLRVMNLGRVAGNAKDYDVAIKAYQYIVDEKGENNSYYFQANNELLSTKRKRITQNFNYTIEDLRSLDEEYKSFLSEFGVNSRTAYLAKQYGDFQALYLNDLPSAVTTLRSLVETGGINNYVTANSKLSLADYLLMEGDIWESTLLYSQVDKEFKEEHLGELARFKNAMLSYYNGDFEWAQAQFDILKSATSRLISNDAIDRSVHIMDNLNLDTTAVPLQMYAQAELLNFQNRYEESFEKLDSIKIAYPKHSLEDDILYVEAQLHKKLKQYDEAESIYKNIFENYPEEIRADNAIFELAEMYEQIFEKPEEAEKLYEKLFLDYSNSTFAVEARKRYRILRGDDIQ